MPAWGTLAGLLTMVLALFAAPLMLGSYVVVQRASAVLWILWIGLLVSLLAGAVALGLLGLLALLPR